MALERYAKPSDLPARLAVFPLAGALLLPRTHLPLNIFEPRYLAMVDDALSGSSLIGMIQPDSEEGARKQSDPGERPSLYSVGCAGRITSYAETPDNRVLVTLSGICRFRVKEEVDAGRPYRMVEPDFAPYSNDLVAAFGEENVDRDALLAAFKAYLDHHNMQADWKEVSSASTESLVNTLCMISPYPPQEKQALLEAPDLQGRAETLVTLTRMALAQPIEGTERRLQ